MKIGAFFVLTLSLLFLSSHAFAYNVVVTEETRGEYKSGAFTPGPGLYRYSFDVNERSRKVSLTNLDLNGNTSQDSEPQNYEILSMETKMHGNQKEKIITFSKNNGDLSVETFILGETFFEYCIASSDRFVLSSGLVSSSVFLTKTD